MKPGVVLYQAVQPAGPQLRLVTVPYDTPRGNRLRVEIGALKFDLLEGHARRIHLEVLDWLRGRAVRGVLFELCEAGGPLRLVARPDGRLQLEIDTVVFIMLSGHARSLHLALRGWVREQKALRGDTPRGRRRLVARAAAAVQEVVHAPADG